VRALLKREEKKKSRAARNWDVQGRLYDLERGEPETEMEAFFRRGRSSRQKSLNLVGASSV
jgi:hypothetical protein